MKSLSLQYGELDLLQYNLHYLCHKRSYCDTKYLRIHHHWQNQYHTHRRQKKGRPYLHYNFQVLHFRLE